MCFPNAALFSQDARKSGCFPTTTTAGLIIFSDAPDGGKQSCSSTALLVEQLFYGPVGSIYPFLL